MHGFLIGQPEPMPPDLQTRGRYGSNSGKRPLDRLKLLVSAYACRPHQISEAGMAWSYVRAAARHHDVWVLTRTYDRQQI
jgi:hypothetical protein